MNEMLTDKESFERALRQWQGLNGGKGLVLPKVFADEARRLGVEVPFIEAKLLPC